MKGNILLIIMDTVRADRLSCYGYSKETTPFLDSLAREGVRFKSCFSTAPWTPPAHASLFTGTHSIIHGVKHGNRYLGDDLPTLPEIVKSIGYQTAGFSSNPFIGVETGFARGFDFFFEPWKTSSNKWLRRLNKIMDVLSNGLRSDKGAHAINRSVKKWFREDYNPRQPFFLFINYIEPHLPYRPPVDVLSKFLSKEEAEKYTNISQDQDNLLYGNKCLNEEDKIILNKLYDACIYYLDSKIRELFYFLSNEQLITDTLLIVTSDHGENIGDHGLFDHQLSLHNTLLHIPLILWASKDLGREQNSDLVQLNDVFAFILEYLKVDKKMAPYSQGIPLLRGEKRIMAISEYKSPVVDIKPRLIKKYGNNFDLKKFNKDIRSIIKNGKKYIGYSDGEEKLFDLEKDFGEENNIGKLLPAKKIELKEELKKWVNQYKGLREVSQVDHDLKENTISHLKALGYI